MSLHDADVLFRVKKFLDRKQMPRRFESKDEARNDEIRALSAAVKRNAPRDPNRLAEWWPMFEARLSEICGAMWPVEKEIRDAAKQATIEAPRHAVPDGPDMSPPAIIGRRMAAGEAVGEEWLYGRSAVELIAGGHVDEATMRRYRSAAYLSRKAMYKSAAATAWEDDAKARHDEARAAHRARESARPRDISVPDLRADTADVPGWSA